MNTHFLKFILFFLLLSCNTKTDDVYLVGITDGINHRDKGIYYHYTYKNKIYYATATIPDVKIIPNEGRYLVKIDASNPTKATILFNNLISNPFKHQPVLVSKKFVAQKIVKMKNKVILFFSFLPLLATIIFAVKSRKKAEAISLNNTSVNYTRSSVWLFFKSNMFCVFIYAIIFVLIGFNGEIGFAMPFFVLLFMINFLLSITVSIIIYLSLKRKIG